MLHLDLFSGIGGFAYAVDRVWPGSTHVFCDNNKFCQKVLAKHWPGSVIYGDIREFNKKLEDGIITPCLFQNYVVTANKNQEQTTQIGEKSVLQKLKGKGFTEAKRDTKNTNRGLEKQQKNLERGLLKPTGENVVVAEKQNHHSSQLITSMEEEQKRENQFQDYSFIEKSETAIIQKDTNYYATTAITGSTGSENVPIKIDLLTAGVPCQPASQAGKRRGKEDDRWLWPETFTTIKLTTPSWVILENVRGILTLERGMVFKELLAELESLGYETLPFIIPACAVNAPHRRDRVWIIGHSTNNGLNGTKNSKGNKKGDGDNQKREEEVCKPERADSLRFETKYWERDWLEVAAKFCVLDDGLPVELGEFKLTKAGHRVEQLKAYGNAIVPEVSIMIMRAIKEL